MGHLDRRGLPTGSQSAAARDAVETALWRMMTCYDTPLADLAAARSADDRWCLPHLMHAGHLLGLGEASLLEVAAESLEQARARIVGATPARERAHLDALERVLAGRWAAAGRVWDQLLLEHPRDALALHWAQQWDLWRGDAQQLRVRPARALPEWDAADPLYPGVLGLYAFGLVEGREYAAAEDAGRQALAADPRVPCAVHAVAHAMEMQGRFDDGAAWLRQQQGQWAEGNRGAVHLWWHMALFRLEALDHAGVLRLLDKHLCGDALQGSLARVDAASLLWRLQLQGLEVGARSLRLVEDWAPDPAQAGMHAFIDLHIVLALIAADEVARAEHWVARCAERALAGADLRRDNHTMAREVGLPLMRGVLALARGDADGAADAIYPARHLARRLGGSQVQRDLVDQTLLAAAARGSRRALGRALLNERRMARPASPLTRHWAEQLGTADGPARA